jgi:magnesium transporter
MTDASSAARPPEDLPELDTDAAMEDGRMRGDFIASVLEALNAGDRERLDELVEPLHPADYSDLLTLVDAGQRSRLISALKDRLDADVIAELDDTVREDVVEQLDSSAIADVATQLDTDDAVALIEDLEADQQREVLEAMPAVDRQAIEEALTYPEESAGRLMQRDLIAAPDYWTVGQTIDFLRENPDLATEFYDVFVVDAQHRPVGAIRLSWILRTPRSVALTDVMAREMRLIEAETDREDVARQFQKYGLISAPVVNADGRLVGVITVDDVIHVISEEAQEDILALAGAGGGDVNEAVLETVKSRLPWLIVNLLTAMLSSTLIGFFDATIQQMVALAVLMPIVSAIGGNAGTQTMTVAVRALALNQLATTNFWRVLWREVRVNMLNAVALAVLMGGVAALWFGCWALGAVMAAAMICNLFIAGLGGVFIPMMFERLKVDPASASAVFVTALTDCFGFTAFLGLAVLAGVPNFCQSCCGL